VRHHHRVVQINLAALPDDPAVLQRMLQEIVPELQAENEKLWQLIQRLLRHRYGPRSEKLYLDQLQLVLEDAEQSAAEETPRRTRQNQRKDGGAPRQSTAIAVHCPHTCHATRSSSTSRARNAPAVAVRCM